MVAQKEFKLGDIIELNSTEYDGLLMIVSFSNEYYNAVYVTGDYDGAKTKVYLPDYYIKVGNIFDGELK
jgi:hypothetical protein